MQNASRQEAAAEHFKCDLHGFSPSLWHRRKTGLFACFDLRPGNNIPLVRFLVKTDLSPSFAFPLMCCCRTIQMFASSKFSLWQGSRSLVMTLIAPASSLCCFEATGLQSGDVRKCSLAWERDTCPTLISCPGHLVTGLSAATLKGHRHPPVSCLEPLSRQFGFRGD